MGIKLNTSDIIKHSAFETFNNGYVKRNDSDEIECTADKVFDSITKNLVNETSLETVKERIEDWYKYIEKQSGEYFDNIKKEIAHPKIDESKIGLIASSFATFDKFSELKESASNDYMSEYLGDEGDKITINIKDYRLLKSGTSKSKNGQSYKWFFYRIHDEHDNVITWFASENNDFEFKHCDKITATISKLSMYNDIKQTCITRVKFID